MPLLSVALAVALMLVLVAWVKLDAFLALLLTAFAVGLVNGLGALGTLQSILRGLGATLGGVTLVLVFGAMLGALVDSSGAARVITQRLVARFGPRRVQLAMVLTGFLVGLPMLYNAGFLLLIPLVYTVAAQTGLSIVWVGVPLAAALSVTHGFLPPHPAPTFVAFAYGADVNRTLAAGLVAAVPACLLGGVAGWISERATGLRWNPLVVAFAIASLLRLAVGSATVAGMTTAGLLAPTVAASGVRPELMVLATGAGSLMFSHFNDTGFWMFKEYFGLGIRETFATWSVMEVIVALAGLGMALVMQAFLV